jgi:hypothetical protein
MDSAIDTATPQEAAVRGIDDGINVELCNVPLIDLNHDRLPFPLLGKSVAASAGSKGCGQ